MTKVIPNITAILGSSLAAKILASAGGLEELVKIPAGNIQVLGQQRKVLHGMSTASVGLHRGHIGDHNLVVRAPKEFKRKVIRMLSTKSALAARIDIAKTCPSGKKGDELFEGILKRYNKI